MAVQATKIVSVEQITISVPIGTQLKITDIPSILYVNYNGAPFHGYITFSDSDKRKLLVLNPRTGSTPTSGTTVTGVPVPIDVAADGTITNIPTDIQQEVLLKGGLKNAVVSHTGGDGTAGTAVTITNYEPLVFYISILVGGIDWRPASRFPDDIDLLDHLDGYMKEPVTSSDIPAIDAYQYLISLQTRSQAEDYQLESLKQSLAKKMILARDINYVMACVLAVERAYFDLLERLRRLELRVDYIEGQWLPNLESRLYTSQLNIRNLWDRLLDNYIITHDGLEAAREDSYRRVYRALKHYGSSGTWNEVPIFGKCGSSSDSNASLTGGGSGMSYNRYIVDPNTGEYTRQIKISAAEPGSESGGITDNVYIQSVYGFKNIKFNSQAHAFYIHAGRWSDDIWKSKTKSGDSEVEIKECFHNLIVMDSLGSGGMIATQNHLGFYENINKSDVGIAEKMLFKVHGGSGSAYLHLFNDWTAFTVNETKRELRLGRPADSYGEFSHRPNSYVFVGYRNKPSGSAGLVVQPFGEAAAGGDKVFITGERIHFANSTANQAQYMNIHNAKTSSGSHYVIINIGNGGNDNDGGFFIGKTGSHVVMEYEAKSKEYCGISYSNDGLHLYGLSQDTLDELSEYFENGTPGKEIGPGRIDKSISELCTIPLDVFDGDERNWRITNTTNPSAPSSGLTANVDN